MTKKDYEVFARMFKSYTVASEGIKDTGVYTCPDMMEICKRTADIFGNDNPRFDRARYLEACGVRKEDR